MPSRTDNTLVKRGANLLLKGATLTDLSCPKCGSPLFRLKDGTLWCEKDEKKVVVVKQDQEPSVQAPSSNGAYTKLEATLMTKIQEIEGKIEKTQDVDELQKLALAMSELLNNVEKIKKIKG